MKTLMTALRRLAIPIIVGALCLDLWQPTLLARAQHRDVTTFPAHAPLPLKSAVQDKNFYLLSLLANDAPAAKALAGSTVLKKLLDTKRAALPRIFQQSESGDARSIAELTFTEEEVGTVGTELTRLYETSAEIRRLVDGPLRASGLYLKYSAESGDKLVALAWRDCALGLNNIVAVYGLGKDGRSPAIDGISYDVKSEFYNNLLHNLIGVQVDDPTPPTLFFQPTLQLALGLLDANRRDEAGRFEPMERGENRAAFRRVGSVDWNRYPYSVILVPGEGPDEHDVRLSPVGKLRLTFAARRFRQGKAPFLLVSGGYVHPKQTPYCEAYEMKRSLMQDFGVPENAIIIDPHARHTTTNLRNAARLIYRYGIPFDKPGLVSSDTGQCDYIESKDLHDRCQSIFGYQPCQILKRLSPFDLEFRPNIDSLYADPIDPLDP
jgi:hypothetical protein